MQANLGSSAPVPEVYSVNSIHVVEETTNRHLEAAVQVAVSVAEVQPYQP